jgi:hypothetical protein
VEDISKTHETTEANTIQQLCSLKHSPTSNMPAVSDVLQFMRGQLFQTPQLPKVDFTGKTVVVTGAIQALDSSVPDICELMNVSQSKGTKAHNQADSASMFQPSYSVVETLAKVKLRRKP